MSATEGKTSNDRDTRDDKPTPHPAKFSAGVIDTIGDVLRDHLPSAGGPAAPAILDPFAGVGGIHEFSIQSTGAYHTYAVEIEPEWAEQSALIGPTWCGDFFEFDPVQVSMAGWYSQSYHQWPTQFDAIVTSPTYGNRMADRHNARDDSSRITYKHKLNRDLTPNNSGGMQWGNEYKLFHRKAWTRCRDLLAPDGYMIVNVSDHVRRGEIMPVVQWHRDRLEALGFVKVDDIKVRTRRMRFGQNHAARVSYEHVLVYVKGDA